MTFRTPWRWPLFVATVTAVRRVLRPFGPLEGRFIRRLVHSHNQRVTDFIQRYGIRSILLIMPRCLKPRGCPVDVRGSIAPCLDCSCRECPLREIARLTEEFGVRALVAFRSHVAFAMARREQPDLILATACEDRLIKALRRVPEIPALLVPLGPRERPCSGAVLDLPWFETQLRLASERVSSSPTSLPTAESPVAIPATNPSGKKAVG